MTFTERPPLTEDQLVKDLARAEELLLALAWHSTDYDMESPHWKAAKRWLEQRKKWAKP